MLRSPPSVKPKPELQRRRTVEMYERMEDRDWETDQITIDGEPYLTIDNVNYRILDSGVTEFDNRDKPLVSVGAHLSRELIILDPTNHYLQNIYRKLRRDIENFDQENQNIQDILDYTISFVRSYLKPDPGKLKAKVEVLCSDSTYYLQSASGDPLIFKNNPVISLDTFLEEGFGLCRHHGLFTAYLLNNLVLDRLLPAGHTYYHRDTVQSGGAHVWCIYKPLQSVDDNAQYNFYLVDSLWQQEAFNLKHYAPFFEEWGYGERAIQYVMNRHNRPDIESIAYHKIDERDWRIKDDFIYDLLDASKEMCRTYLNHQYRLGAGHEIRLALETIPKYRNHRNYQALLVDLDRVLNRNLYKEYFADLHDPDDSQQFILGLLCKSEHERSFILDDQGIEDLRLIIIALKTASLDKKYLFQQFDNYHALLNEIENLVEVKMLHRQPFHEIQKSVNKERFMIGLLLCKAKERNFILNRQNLIDLNLMHQLLVNQKSFYKNLNTYKDVLSELESRIEVKLLHEQHYDKILSGNTRQKFITELLLCKTADRVAILDKQTMTDLEHLKKSIVNRNPTYLKQHYDSYQYVLQDIEDHLKVKNILHNVSYYNLESKKQREQFISGLLLCCEQERDSILDNQDILDIKYLHQSLSELYKFKQFDNYEPLMDELNKRINLESLGLIKKIILSGQLELKSDWAPSFWSVSGKKISLSADASIRVPTSAKVIYDKIKMVDLETANSETIEILIGAIRTCASNAAANDHKDRTENTRALLNILKNDYEPIKLLKKLEGLHKNLMMPSKPVTDVKQTVKM